MTNPDIDFNVDDIFLRYEQEQLLPLNNVPAENFADTKTVTGHDGEPKTFGLVDGVAYALPQSYSTTSYFPPHPEGDSGEVVTPFVQVGTYPTRNFAKTEMRPV